MSPILTGVIASGISGNLTPPWSPEGAYDALATVTVPAGGAATVTFAGIPNTYKHLQIRAIAKNTLTNVYTANFYMRFNGDTGTNYSNHAIYGTGSSVVPNIPTGANPSFAIWGLSGSSQFAGHIIDILDYANTSKNKTTRILMGTDTSSGGYLGLESGAWMNTSAINSISFSMGDGTQTIAQYSQFSLYGVK
jgi:hypothetical protein